MTAVALMNVQELQEFHSALEEAKADIVGLWALNFLINKVSYFTNYKSIMARVLSLSLGPDVDIQILFMQPFYRLKWIT